MVCLSLFLCYAASLATMITLNVTSRLTCVTDKSDSSRSLSLTVVKMPHFSSAGSLLALEVHSQVILRHIRRNSAHFHCTGQHAVVIVACP